jgi:hypothetical protein
MNTFYKKHRIPIEQAAKTLTQCAVTGTTVFSPMSAQSFALPSNTTSPTVSGTFQVGSTITVNPNVWSGDQPVTLLGRTL